MIVTFRDGEQTLGAVEGVDGGWLEARRGLAMQANDRGVDGESKEGRGSGGGCLELLLRRATAAAVFGEIGAAWWLM
jgi:hypothetical protein